MLVLIISTIIILILLSQLKLSVHNIKNINYVRVKLLIFTIDLDYTRFMKTLKRLGFENDIDLKEKINIYKTMNPIFKDIVSQTVVEKALFYKFFNEYSETYKIITYYLFSAYLNGMLEANCKKLQNYKYEVLYSKERNDIDFTFVCKISIYKIFYAVIKNLKMLFKYLKRRTVNGS